MSDSTQTSDSRCRVHLEVFEGPLDLLLYLIKRDEIDIYDIPISHVANEFVEYLENMRELDLSIAGEYLLMAAMLMSIKARMLLPRGEADTDEIEDPRAELVNMLLEYQVFKKISEDLAKKREQQTRHFPKGSFPDAETTPRYLKPQELIPMDLYSLIRTAWELLKQENLVIPGYEGEDIDVGERMNEIDQFISERGKARFVDLFTGPTTPMMFVVTFVGLLELIRVKKVKVQQRTSFGNIWLYAVSDDKDE